MSNKNKILTEIEDVTHLYDEYNNWLEKSNQTNQNSKNKFADQINENADFLIKEIEKKEANNEKEKKKKISFILKKVKKKYGSKEDLSTLSYNDVNEIYDRVKKSNQSLYKKLFQFIFNS